MNFSQDAARDLLTRAGLFFEGVEDEGEPEKWAQTINLNDSMFWACADGEYVPDEELPEVARLFWLYGWCGILFWVVEKRPGTVPEFRDARRFVEFARNEEQIRAEVPSPSKRAYEERSYTLGNATSGRANRRS